LAVTRVLAAALSIAGLCCSWPSVAMPLMPQRGMVVLVQDKSEADFAALDARLEAAAVTATLIRTYNVVVALAEQNLNLMSVLTKLLPRDSNSSGQPSAKEAAQEREAEIRGAMDTALESYMRLIGEIDNSSSQDDIGVRADVVQRAMGFRGQGSMKSAMPTILLHIKLIHAHAAPSRETILKDLSALPTR
jgi:hypothetical protein